MEEKNVYVGFGIDVYEYESVEKLNEQILTTNDIINFLGNDINYIILDDIKTNLSYTFVFQKFDRKYLVPIEHVFINRGLKHFSYVKRKKELNPEDIICDFYFSNDLKLLVKTLNLNDTSNTRLQPK
jgi:hypothetical protein